MAEGWLKGWPKGWPIIPKSRTVKEISERKQLFVTSLKQKLTVSLEM